jgi:hypothetical protein
MALPFHVLSGSRIGLPNGCQNDVGLTTARVRPILLRSALE